MTDRRDHDRGAPPVDANAGSAVRPLSRRRLAAAVAGCAGVAAAVCALSPLVGVDGAGGGRHLALLDLRAIVDGLAGAPTVDAQLFALARLPRVLAGAVVGAGLAVAGCALQALLRNPLAEPYTVGVSSGASLAALLAIRLGLDATWLGSSAIGLAALAGAAITIYAVWRLAQTDGDLPPAALLLAGLVIAIVCSAASMLVQYTATFSETYRFVRWMMGGLEWIRYGPLWRAAVPTAAGIAVLLWLARDLNALSAGGEAAASVGVHPTRARTIGFFAASLVVGAAISVAGPIGFVGLVVPHVLRGAVGPDHRVLLPASAFAGAAFVVACDTVARIVLAPAQLPVGIVTALIGGAFFAYVFRREKTRARLWGG
ncbi:MAG: iron ABC transporter permease [Deltaproteobacteria bacterium]|nr:MAG: iron ABC transporter permease [Deltaproteobacteria bacterium]